MGDEDAGREGAAAVDVGRLERLAVAQYIYKSIAAEVAGAAKGGEGVRAEVDAALARLWEETGTDRVALSVAGVKVGTMTLKVDDEVTVEDEAAFRAFLLDHGYAEASREVDMGALTREQRERLVGMARLMAPGSVRDVWTVDRKWLKQVTRTPDGRAVWTDTGEPVPGVSMRSVPSGTTLRVDEKKVEPLLRNARGVVAALIGGAVGEEE